MLKENDEKTNLISLDDYYSNFLYKDKKFKCSLKNKLLTLREYFSENPKIFFLAELTAGTIFCGFPIIFLFYFLRSIKFEKNNTENYYDQLFIKAALPYIIVISSLLIAVAIIIVLKTRQIFKSRL